MGNYHARCGAGEKPEVVTLEAYLSLFGQVPSFDKLIATIRSREISASIILQSQSQLKTIYKDSADTIVGNCDSTLFLGGKEKSTLKEISELLGKETIDSYNRSEKGHANLPRPQLPEIRKEVDDTGRIGSYGRRQVYFHAERRASLLLGQIRPHKAPELQIHGRRRP